MTYIPPKNKKGTALAFLLILLGLVLFALSTICKFSGVFQLVAVLDITVGIAVMVRFMLCEYRYILANLSDGNLELTIVKTQGGKEVIVCKVLTSSIEKILPKGSKKPSGVPTYNYVQNIGAKSISLLANDRKGKIIIIIEPSDEFTAFLSDNIGGQFADANFAM